MSEIEATKMADESEAAPIVSAENVEVGDVCEANKSVAVAPETVVQVGPSGTDKPKATSSEDSERFFFGLGDVIDVKVDQAWWSGVVKKVTQDEDSGDPTAYYIRWDNDDPDSTITADQARPRAPRLLRTGIGLPSWKKHKTAA